jgi:ribonuclease BN (tRNA processing enzyme)
MKVIFLGVGEAFDEDVPNNSALVISDTKLLLDCGYAIPTQLWKYNNNQSFLDAVFISHLHADHYFGIPVLLTRMFEEKRTKHFTIICEKGSKKIIQTLMESAYRGFAAKFEFPVIYKEVKEGDRIRLNELNLEFAHSIHSISNLAVRVSDGKHTVCYSGDGMFNERTERLYKNSDLLIHEAFLYDEKRVGHGCMTDLIDMAKRRSIKCIAFTHIQRNFRKKKLNEAKKKLSEKNIKILVPEPFDEFSL